MTGLAWLSVEDACDLLRVPDDNAGVIQQHAASIPAFVEVTTGYPATTTDSDECDEAVRQLCRFVLLQWFNPDGTDATRLSRVISSLTKAVRAMVVSNEG